MKTGVLIIDFLNKGFMKYECLVYNEDYVSLKGKINVQSQKDEDCSYLGEKLGLGVSFSQCLETTLSMEYDVTCWNTLGTWEIHLDLIHMIKIMFSKW